MALPKLSPDGIPALIKDGVGKSMKEIMENIKKEDSVLFTFLKNIHTAKANQQSLDDANNFLEGALTLYLTLKHQDEIDELEKSLG